MHQANESAGSKSLSVTDMGPEDRTPNFGDALTRSGQCPHSKEINLPKHILKTGLGPRKE